jgi:hypothetical protein
MTCIRTILFVLAPLASAVVVGQQVLDNAAIIKMTKAGLSEEIIASTVKAQPGRYTLAADDLISLKQDGVSEKVIAALLAKDSMPAGVVASPPVPSTGEFRSDIVGGGVVTEIGIYVKRNGIWEEVVAEPINWKTGGTVKMVASAGVVKKDMNGYLSGPHSRNAMKAPLELLICTREGESYGEYQLLKLRENNDYREFRYITGGVFNQKGGAQRDLLTYEARKVAPRTYLIALPENLAYGEYGFLPPNLLTTTSASAQLGKMYTFRIPL